MPFQGGLKTTPEEDKEWAYYWIHTCKYYKRITCPIINQCNFKECKHK